MLAAETESADLRRLDVAGVRIEMWSKGQGAPLLFLHPGDGPAAGMAALERLAQRYAVFAPSHPGFGGSDLPDWITTVDDLSYFYLDLIRQQDLGNVTLVGVSFGAWIAAEIAVKCTARIGALVLADAVGAKFGPPTTREIFDLFSLPQFEQGDVIYHDPARRRTDYSGWAEQDVVRQVRNHESFTLFGWSPTLHNPRLARRLARIDVPTLALWGAEDRVVPPDYGRRFAAAIPGASFSLIAGAGHYPHVEQPERFAVAIENFLGAGAPAR